MSSSSRRKIGLLVLIAVLLTPWAAAAEPGANNDPSAGASWGLLARLWSAVAALWGDNGCHVDPYGGCETTGTPPPPTENLENGCGVDPFGGCRNGS